MKKEAQEIGITEDLPLPTSAPLFGQAMRGVAISSGGDVLLKLAGFTATAIILYQMSPYYYGLWQLLLSVGTAFSVVLVPSIAGMLVADISRLVGQGEKRKANALLLRSIVFFLVLGVLSSLTMGIAASYFTHISGLQMTGFIRLLALTLLFAGVGQGLTLILQTRLEFVHMQATKVIGRTSYLACIALFLLVFHFDLNGLVYAYLVSSILPVALYTPYLVRAIRRMQIDYGELSWKDFFGELRHRGSWVLSSDLVSALVATLSPWMIGYFLSIEMVGLVTIALTFLSQVASLTPVTAMLRPILPRTAGEAWRVEHWITRSMKYTLWLNVVFGTAAFLALSVIVPLFFQKYLAVIPLCAALLASLPFRVLGVVATEWFYTTGNQKDFFIYSKLVGLAMFALIVPLLAFGGLFGYVVGVVLSSDILLLTRLRIMRKKGGIHIKWRELLIVDKKDSLYLKRIVAGFIRRLAHVYG